MLIISNEIKEFLRSLDKDTRKLIGGEIRKFQNDSNVDIIKLHGEYNKWRIAAGIWRIILKSRSGDKGC